MYASEGWEKMVAAALQAGLTHHRGRAPVESLGNNLFDFAHPLRGRGVPQNSLDESSNPASTQVCQASAIR